MDRRQLLFGATALGLAGQFNLNELLNAQSVEGVDPLSGARKTQLPDGC